KDLKDAGLYVEFDTQKQSVIQVRTGISLVSVANASENLQKEISDKFSWDFEAVVQNQKNVWNGILNRLDIRTNDRMEKVRFYTNVYRALCR
ncbi:UNVERIFIED_CONTAM: glycoside hydrolase family 92 protein, partial [Bacteroidetes bacterium 56_B9]